jgi:hypothetical protein
MYYVCWLASGQAQEALAGGPEVGRGVAALVAASQVQVHDVMFSRSL